MKSTSPERERCDEPAPEIGQAQEPLRDPFAPGLLHELPGPPSKIVILRASRIGDFINASPAFHTLRTAFPHAKLTLITLPMLREIAQRLKIFDQILAFPGYPGLAEQFFEPSATLRFLAEMQAEHFDLAIQMQGSGVYSNPFTLMLGAHWTAGFVRPGDPPGRLSAALPFPDGHEAQRNLALLEFLGLPKTDLLPVFPLWQEDHQAADAWLKDLPTPWIGLHTSARDATRRWPLRRFAAAGAQLQQRFGGMLILTGEASERAEMQAALNSTGAPNLNLAGCTNLPVTGAIIQRLALFLTNDTGPAHIAYALGTPTVTIFGGGDPQRNGPPGPGPFQILAQPISCRPCESGTCPIAFRCLDEISVQQVVEAGEKIIRLPDGL